MGNRSRNRDNKRKAVIFSVIFISIAISAIVWKRSYDMRKEKPVLMAGTKAADFTVAYEQSRPVQLSEIYSAHPVVLAFTGMDPRSAKTEALMSGKMNAFSSILPGLAWLEVRREGLSAVIEEKTGSIKLRYRTNYSNIPSVYRSKDLPIVIMIERGGIIRTVYRGFSPTMADDLLDVISEARR